MTVESIWEPDIKEEAELVYGTTDVFHPAVNYLFNQANNVFVGGKIRKIVCQIIMIISIID